ncbi:hypothetical protein KBB96_06065 [Luteolibacter ambystomatis]|uniref:Uncharacterized protein n=1 Tax=Luteolibacter ambystomatis TaxID=2824561 RepID=A0A975J1S5_9BACT|nr:hypothetical protein [Luteolibacter ambystomatis]QUE52455.1 hypothetical protein KBB96_06065 [Luteolibacter ambystomatis]
MRTIPLFVMALVLASADRSPGQVASQELAALKAGNQKDIKALRELYRTKLAALLKAETDKGDLVGAAAVRSELAKFDPSVSASSTGPIGPTAALAKRLLESPTRWLNGDALVEFRPDGVWIETFKGKVTEGRWTREPDSELIRIRANDGSKTFIYRMGEDGSAVFGPAGGRFKRQSDTVATTPPSGPVPAPSGGKSGGDDFNPFGATK